MLLLNTIRSPKGTTKQRKRLGRGPASGHGQTSGKGDKGQLARSGGKVRAGFEGGQSPLYRRLPKRGFTSITKRPMAIINLSQLEKYFGSVAGPVAITLDVLQKRGFCKGRVDRLVVLGQGETKTQFHITAHKFSEGAQKKIVDAGGSVDIIAIGVKQKGVAKKRPEVSA
jgi:large subunit ribosomal protein L15